LFSLSDLHYNRLCKGTGWERKTYKDFEKNLVNGKESDPEIKFYKKKVIEEWQKERVQELIEEAKCETGKNKKLEIQQAYHGGDIHIYSPYDTYIFIRLANKYESGKVRKTWFSKNNVEIRKLRSESRCLAEAWRRVEEKLVSEPMTADQVRAYRAKTG